MFVWCPANSMTLRIMASTAKYIKIVNAQTRVEMMHKLEHHLVFIWTLPPDNLSLQLILPLRDQTSGMTLQPTRPWALVPITIYLTLVFEMVL